MGIFGRIVWFLLFLVPVSIQAQSKPYFRFERLPAEWALSQNTINDVLQDREGFLWMASWLGLIKYDGYNGKLYQQSLGRENGLRSNKFTCLYEDRSGQLWVGTRNGGFYRFDREREFFVAYHKGAGAPGSLSDDNVSVIFEDRDGIFWIGTERGLNRFDPQTGRFAQYFHDPANPESLSHDFVYSICETADGSLWVGTEYGLNRLLKNALPTDSAVRFAHYELSPDPATAGGVSDARQHNFIYKMRASRQHPAHLWIGTTGGLKQVQVDPSAPDSVRIRHFISRPGDAGSLSHNFVTSILEEGDILWAGTFHGLNRLDVASGQFTRFCWNKDDPASLSSDAIKCLYKDKTDLLWVGTDQGVNKLKIQGSAYQQLYLNAVEGPNNHAVTTLAAGRTGKQIWTGSLGGGIYSFQLDAGSGVILPVRHYHFPADHVAQMGNFISFMLEDRAGDLWAMTQGAGVLHIRAGDLPAGGGALRTFRQYVRGNGPLDLSDDYVMSGLESVDGSIWMGFWDKGLNRFDLQTRSIDRFEQIPGSGVDLEAGPVVALCETSRGGRQDLWVGTRGEGVLHLRYEASTRTLTWLSTYKNVPGDSSSLSNDFINHIFEDSRGNIWVGTENGLNRLEEARGTFTRYLTGQGFGGHILSLAEDPGGTLWVSTRAHLRQIRVQDGVPRVDAWRALSGDMPAFTGSRTLVHPSGKLFLGFFNGLFIVNPLAIDNDTTPPGVAIVDFRLFNKSVPISAPDDPYAILTRSITETRAIELAHSDNVISFEFVALHFVRPSQNRYAYMLDGFHKDWIYTDAEQRFAHFTGLPHGKFDFLVKAANPDGLWGTPARISLTIRPPFWLTWWACVLYLLLFAGLLYGVRSLTLMRANLHNKLQLERIEREKLEEIDLMKSRFFTNISHDLRTPLTLIVSPMEELVREKTLDRRLHTTLRRMLANAHRLMNLVNQLLDLRKSEAGLMKIQAAEGNLVKFIREVSLAFREQAQTHKITLSVRSERESLRVWYDRDEMEKVFFNLISNAFKFTPPGGAISLEISQTADEAIVRVRDTGAGISDSDLPRIFERFYQAQQSPDQDHPEGSGIGLAIVQSIVEQHGGRVAVESEPGAGACFSLFLPLGEVHLTASQKISGFTDSEDIASYPALSPALSHEVFKPVSPAAPASEQGKQLILVVEDNPDIRAYLRENLETEYEIQEAPNGRLALQMALDKPPDLIISDIAMPEMDGIEFCRAIKTHVATSHIPVLLLTARTALLFKINGLETGADDYITKPFNMQLLQARVANLIRIRLELKERFSRQYDLSPGDMVIHSLDETFLDRFKAIVEAHIEDPEFAVEQLAEGLNISRMQLYRKLKALTGQSPKQVIRHFRLTRAAQLLASGQYNVSEVTYMVGYQDLKSFRLQFKKQFGSSPSDFPQDPDGRKKK